MEDWRQRTRLLLGEEKMERLQQAHVLVVGLGGVGAYAAEMICRAGVGRMTIVDADTVQPTNINRQLPALHSTLEMSKAEILEKRFRDINPEIELTKPASADEAVFSDMGGMEKPVDLKVQPVKTSKNPAKEHKGKIIS